MNTPNVFCQRTPLNPLEGFLLPHICGQRFKVYLALRDDGNLLSQLDITLPGIPFELIRLTLANPFTVPGSTFFSHSFMQN